MHLPNTAPIIGIHYGSDAQSALPMIWASKAPITILNQKHKKRNKSGNISIARFESIFSALLCGQRGRRADPDLSGLFQTCLFLGTQLDSQPF